ncbi:hypothetical protein DE146DRAFT_794034 [Phaeosphaeria sp. MPI-PUGE-AT-0046c]|nr:hypothetical protein DE146DRAFT_794034 [Phaeosphaeria sp. MPI-PUGE-AT-0046c]
MMKRKFSFNLAPVKTTKDDTKPATEPAPSLSQTHSDSHSNSHRRLVSKDSISDYSPFISRRVLDPKTDHELRAACQLILQNFKPSDHGMENTDPKLDFGGLQRPREHRTKERNAHRSDTKARVPTGAPVDLKAALAARGLKQTGLTLALPADAPPVRANSSRKRADFAWLDERNDKRDEKLRKSSSMKRKTSTADNAAAAHAQATETTHQERDKPDSSHPQTCPSTGPRPLSRARSIRDNIREYVFPGTTSRTLSRAPSHGSLRTMNTTFSQDSSSADPPPSATGWRSWALPRRSSSRSSSRPGTSKEKPEEVEQPKKLNTVNLNRELPPLPSLDSWKDSVQEPEPKPISPISPSTSTHIANLMRPQEQSSAAKNKTHRRSGSDTLAMQYNASMATRSPTNNKHSQSGSRSKTLTPDSLAVTSSTLVGSASTSNLGHIRQGSGSSSTPKKSGEILNFSSNVSVDTPTRSTFSNEVKVSRKEEQKSRLKKVFSGWMTKKEKKDDWMHRIEKEGVKEGVMVQGGAADPPVVRY